MSWRKGSSSSEGNGRRYLSIVAEKIFADRLGNASKKDGRSCACCGAKVSGGLKANGILYCSKSCFLMMAAH